MSDPTPYSNYPDNDQGPYWTSNTPGANNGASPYADPTYPNAGSEPYPPSQPNTFYPGQSYYPPAPNVMYPPQPEYPAYGGYRPAQTNGPGIASLILGIVGLAIFWIPFVGLPVSIVGLIVAAVGMKRLDGKGFAVAGLVLSIIGIILGGCITAATISAIHGAYYP